MTGDHGHDDGGGGHDHGPGDDGHHGGPPSEVAARALALESLLVEKGLITHEAVDRVVSAFENDIGPLRGARAVARAWVDEGFRRRLLDDPRSALSELGLAGPGITEPGAELVVVENTAEVHNMVVCTLCSCYPWVLLGLPPTWYKSAPYRSRAVREPRRVLAEMGLELPGSVEVRVWDSTADVRYAVLPRRPDGTEGWTEDQLVPLVTRDCMIGVAVPRVPVEAA